MNLLFGQLICYLTALTVLPFAGPTAIQCVSEEARSVMGMEHAAGWYNGDSDTAFVVVGLSPGYTREVLDHELAHAWDLRLGTQVNGSPAFFSEIATGFSVEEFARLQTLWRGTWPANEAFPDVTPTAAEWAAMDRAGWLMPRL